MPKQKGPTPWDIAKPLLEAEYISGEITDEMEPWEVYLSKDEYMAVEKYENFRSNFACLKNTIRKHWNRSVDDDEGLQRDMIIHKLARDAEGCWEGSEAQRLLKSDMEANKHKTQKPRFLWAERGEYKEFTKKVFRDHIYQDERSKRSTNYWIVHRKKLKMAKAAKKRGEELDFNNIDWYDDPVLRM
jgi:hypothetical protein